MNPEDPQADPPEEELAQALADWDQELSASGETLAADDRNISSEITPRLARDMECVRLLRAVWNPGDSVGEGIRLPHGDTQRIGRFEIRRELGCGGYGVVFLAYDPQLHREVALKVPRGEALLTPDLRARFQHEARAAAALDHPHIVPVYDAGEVGPICYIASAYCPGETLAQWLGKQTTPVPLNDAARLVATLAEAVAHAHSRGILHRDLKPANVLLAGVRGQGSGVRGEKNSEVDDANGAPILDPKITDFGLARVLSEADANLTRTGAVLGTPQYMAPEQATGRARDVSTAADVYALGAILYELLTSRPLFMAETPLATLRAVETESPPSPRQLRSDVPRDLETICLKCLEKHPSHRYTTAHALADDLRRFIAGEPVMARPVSAMERVGRWCRRNKMTASLAATVLAALTAAAILGSYSAVAAVRRREAEIKAALSDMEADQARQEHLASQRHFYLSSMLVAQRAWEESNPIRLRELLATFEPRGGDEVDRRGFEWHYWNSVQRRGFFIARNANQCARAVAFHPVGGELAAAGEDGMLRIYDVATSRQRLAVQAHDKLIGSVSYSRDGRLLVTASDDGVVRVWNADTIALLQTLKGHTGEATCAVFSPDARSVVSAGRDATVIIWDLAVASPRRVLRGHEGPVRCVAFSPDGTQLASGGDDRVVRTWNAASGEPGPVFAKHSMHIYQVTFSPDGRQLATASDDRSAIIWEWATGQVVHRFRLPDDSMRCVAFDPTGRRLATGARDRTVRVWDTVSGDLKMIFRGPTHLVDAVTFNGDGTRLAAASRDGSLWLWDPKDSQESLATVGHPISIDGVSWSRDGRWLASASHDGTVRVWKVGSFELARTLDGQGVKQCCVAFNPDGTRLAAGRGDGGVCVWEWPSGRQLGVFPIHAARLYGIAWSHGEILATAAADGAVILSSAATGDVIRKWTGHVGPAYGVAISYDGRWVASCGEDRTVRVWNGNTGEQVTSHSDHEGQVYSIAFSPDGRYVASASHDNTARIWDWAAGQTRHILKGHVSVVHGVAFSTDGRRLATASIDHTVRLWDMATGSETLILRGHNGVVHCAAFSPDDRFLASAAQNGGLRIWPPPGN